MTQGSEETKMKVDSAGEVSDVDNENCSSSGSGGGGGGGSSSETKKTCVDCGTFRTPLWRGGPAGPKSLCNACGIKSRKKRQAALGIKPEGKKKKKSKRSNSSSSDLSLENKIDDDDDDDAKTCTSKTSTRRFLDSRFKAPVMKKSVVEKIELRSEEERAAWLLMRLSWGSVYA